MIDIFQSIIDPSKQNSSFSFIRESKAHDGPRRLINEIYNSAKPIDKDFIIQFQGRGFDARIWELYLLAVFQELNFSINRNHDRPDFELMKRGTEIFVEAVTTNTSDNKLPVSKHERVKNLKEEEFENFFMQLRNESTIKIAGALYSKLKLKYWELPWVKGKPFIIAAEPFHDPFAQMLSDSNLVGYLYGFDNTWYHDEKGQLIINTFDITEHTHGPKVIPSNFFSLEGSENISAVIFSNSGTMAKFSRIAKLKGYTDSKIVMIREGLEYDHDPNASHPKEFKYLVGMNGPKEDWAQGVCMYHNPNARFPIDRKLFPNILHGYNKPEFHVFYPENFWPVQSETQIIVPESFMKKN